jgi:hypothetical protein
MRNNYTIFSYQKQAKIKTFWLFRNLKVGEFHYYSKIVELHGQHCYLSGTKTIERDGKMEFIIIISILIINEDK